VNPVNDEPLCAIEAFAGLRVLVIGDAMLDSYLEGTTERLCQEAPVPVVSVRERRDAPGGAANTALNVRALGAEVMLLGAIGDDAEGHALAHALSQEGVENLLGPCVGRKTLAKTRVLALAQVLVRFDRGDTAALAETDEERLMHRLRAVYPECDAVIVSDYGYGVLTPRIIETLAELQREAPRILVGDSKRLGDYRHVGMTAVKPNYREALQLLCLSERRDARTRVAALLAEGERLLDATGARIVALTLDTEGALVFEKGQTPFRTFTQPNPQSRAAGAGDTFVSALALALATGCTTPIAAQLASAAAAVVVGKDGTACCTARELQARLAADDKRMANRYVLAARLDEYRRQGRRIVFTNGCFDILHRGHVNYLARARALGDVLVVGVNEDATIRRLKGAGRPINALDDRLQVLAALQCVDHVIPFDEETPHNLIRVVRPDVFVKGGDYTRDRLPEAALVEELGGTVHILGYTQDRSTTGLIDRIRRAGADGALQAPHHAPHRQPRRNGVPVLGVEP
jgi:D-beta-D-heptose 7-phosphate kinase / D-beta-D-heptose 1-phosphate adenosyltransferase